MTHRPGRFGPYGGRYVAETLIPALEELERAYEGLREDPSFREELADLLHRYSGLRAQIRLDGWQQAASFEALADRLWAE